MVYLNDARDPELTSGVGPGLRFGIVKVWRCLQDAGEEHKISYLAKSKAMLECRGKVRALSHHPICQLSMLCLPFAGKTQSPLGCSVAAAAIPC